VNEELDRYRNLEGYSGQMSGFVQSPKLPKHTGWSARVGWQVAAAYRQLGGATETASGSDHVLWWVEIARLACGNALRADGAYALGSSAVVEL
jgi:hypothetical protein